MSGEPIATEQDWADIYEGLAANGYTYTLRKVKALRDDYLAVADQLDAANLRLAAYETAAASATVEGIMDLADRAAWKRYGASGGIEEEAEALALVRAAVTAIVVERDAQAELSTYNSVATMEAVVARDEAIERAKRAEAVVLEYAAQTEHNAIVSATRDGKFKTATPSLLAAFVVRSIREALDAGGTNDGR